MKERVITNPLLSRTVVKRGLLISVLGILLTGPSVHFAGSSADIVGDMTVEQLFSYHPSFQSQYNEYRVDDGIDLKDIVDIKVVILFGTWCHDSNREVPRMLSILNKVGLAFKDISLISLDINKQEPKGREKKLNLRNTPTFVIFRKENEIGRIIERPEKSLEEDLMNIINR